jgi:transcriptional regulator of acetoin/glycerol metabolism
LLNLFELAGQAALPPRQRFAAASPAPCRREHVLETVGGNRTRVAQVLGVDRCTLYRMAERFGVNLAYDT